jgi:hypothetical protein
MSKPANLKEGVEFAELTSSLSSNITDLCEETYAATKRPRSASETRDLVKRAKAQITEFEDLLQSYSGGRRESIVTAGDQIDTLKEFTEALEAQLEKR